MYKHHEESIQNMIAHYRENPEIKALFLVGSVATGTERPDSDLDGVAIVSMDYRNEKRNGPGLEEVYRGKCTYEGGYFNIHYMAKEDLIRLGESGSEPMRNMFCSHQVLFCDDPELVELAAKIPVFQESEVAEKQLNFYCTFRMFEMYFLRKSDDDSYMRLHIADGMIYNLYRLLLLENKILFPSMRKLEEYVIRAENKPEGIIEKCRKLIKTLAIEDFVDVLQSYQNWTSYDYPKNNNIVMNHFKDPYEWQ